MVPCATAFGASVGTAAAPGTAGEGVPALVEAPLFPESLVEAVMPILLASCAAGALLASEPLPVGAFAESLAAGFASESGGVAIEVCDEAVSCEADCDAGAASLDASVAAGGDAVLEDDVSLLAT